MIAPVLFVVFNRPGPTAKVFEAIRQARPSRLYVAADGPRSDRLGEAELCASVRSIAIAVDWPCELLTLLREENLGCRLAVSSAITWFFKHEPEGIILEDDCLPHPTFFSYCTELLAHYRNDERVMVISGDNTISTDFPTKYDYVLSRYPLIWGWASWARAWKRYDFASFQSDDRLPAIGRVTQRRHVQAHWSRVFDQVASGKIDSWGYPWCYCLWKNDGLCAIPAVNLISNIGFGPGATHTLNEVAVRSNAPTMPIALPRRHPVLRPLPGFEAAIEHHIHGIPPRKPLAVRVLRKVTSTAKRMLG